MILSTGPPSWAEYRKRRRVLLAVRAALLLVPLGAVCLPALVAVGLLVAGLLLQGVAFLYVVGWRCPRCLDFFHDGFLLLSKTCVHCSLPIDAPIKAGFCHACAYPLCGNLSGVCPECGTPVTAPDTTKGAA